MICTPGRSAQCFPDDPLPCWGVGCGSDPTSQEEGCAIRPLHLCGRVRQPWPPAPTPSPPFLTACLHCVTVAVHLSPRSLQLLLRCLSLFSTLPPRWNLLKSAGLGMFTASSGAPCCPQGEALAPLCPTCPTSRSPVLSISCPELTPHGFYRRQVFSGLLSCSHRLQPSLRRSVLYLLDFCNSSGKQFNHRVCQGPLGVLKHRAGPTTGRSHRPVL